jgi:hypothetical protein
MFMCVVNLKSVNKLDLTWKQSFLIATSVLYQYEKDKQNVKKELLILKDYSNIKFNFSITMKTLRQSKWQSFP